MKIIEYAKLYKYFTTTANLDRKPALRNIWRVRQLPQEYKQLIVEILDDRNRIPEFECYGITLKELIGDRGLTAINAVLYLDWVRRDPITAVNALVHAQTHASLARLTKEDTELINGTLKELKDQYPAVESPYTTPKEESSEEDIVVD